MFMASSFAFWIEPRPVELKVHKLPYSHRHGIHRHLLLQSAGADSRQSLVVCTPHRDALLPPSCEAPTRGLRGLICTGGPRPPARTQAPYRGRARCTVDVINGAQARRVREVDA